MKRLITLIGFIFSSISVYAGYYDIQHYKVVADTINIHTDWYYRGDINVGTSTGTVNIVLQKDGKVGIGTNSPTGTVQISTATGATSIFVSSTTGNTAIGGTSPSYPLDISGVLRNTGAAYFATTSGNVGIGKTNPQVKLDMIAHGNNAENGIRIYSNNVTQYADIGWGKIDASLSYKIEGANGVYLNETQTTPTYVGHNLEVTGYSKFGSTAPSLKCVAISTKTATLANTETKIAHGSAWGKIRDVQCWVDDGSHTFYPPETTTSAASGYNYSIYFDNTYVYLRTHATDSSNILDKDARILVWFEE